MPTFQSLNGIILNSTIMIVLMVICVALLAFQSLNGIILNSTADCS